MGKFLAGLAIGILFGVLGLGAFDLWNSAKQPDDPLPPLVAGLPSDINDTGAAFNQRLNERHPIGSEEGGLVFELWAEGFAAAGGLTEDGEKYAEYSRSFFPCLAEWRVSWAADENGRLATMVGRYVQVCP